MGRGEGELAAVLDSAPGSEASDEEGCTGARTGEAGEAAWLGPASEALVLSGTAVARTAVTLRRPGGAGSPGTSFRKPRPLRKAPREAQKPGQGAWGGGYTGATPTAEATNRADGREPSPRGAGAPVRQGMALESAYKPQRERPRDSQREPSGPYLRASPAMGPGTPRDGR